MTDSRMKRMRQQRASQSRILRLNNNPESRNAEKERIAFLLMGEDDGEWRPYKYR